MTATGITGRGPGLPGGLARCLRGAGLSGTALAVAGAAGALVSLRAAHPRPPRAVPPGGWLPPRSVPQGRLAVAVVLRASGSVITDAIGPYEVFARSPEFFVYTVSAGPAAVLSGELAVVPDYSLRDVDAGTAPEPDVVVIPAVASPNGRKEQPLREWLAGRGAHLLGVCAGSRLLAAAGLLDSHRATTHWSRIRGLQRSRPQVDWVGGQRYIQDGSGLRRGNCHRRAERRQDSRHGPVVHDPRPHRVEIDPDGRQCLPVQGTEQIARLAEPSKADDLTPVRSNEPASALACVG